LIALAITVHPTKTGADVVIPTIPPKETTKSDLVQLVYKYGEQYHVNPQVMINTINCEDTTWEPQRQSDIVNKGVREESYGLSQINLPSNPNVTKEQAKDPEFAIEFMAKKMADGRSNMWSCYRQIYN
jgi:glutamate formiminotransferase